METLVPLEKWNLASLTGLSQPTFYGFSADSAKNVLWLTERQSNQVICLSQVNGHVLNAASIDAPLEVAADGLGNLFVTSDGEQCVYILQQDLRLRLTVRFYGATPQRICGVEGGGAVICLETNNTIDVVLLTPDGEQRWLKRLLDGTNILSNSTPAQTEGFVYVAVEGVSIKISQLDMSGTLLNVTQEPIENNSPPMYVIDQGVKRYTRQRHLLDMTVAPQTGTVILLHDDQKGTQLSLYKAGVKVKDYKSARLHHRLALLTIGRLVTLDVVAGQEATVTVFATPDCI